MSVNKISQPGEEALVAEEGEVLKAYRCPAGVWTIGVGLTRYSGVVNPRSGMTITRAESRSLLHKALDRNYAPRVVKMGLNGTQHVFDGSLMFDFNTGKIHSASWVKKFLSGAMQAAESSFKAWNKGGGRVLKGLVRRRATEWLIISKGKYPKHGKGVAPKTVSSSDETVAKYQEQLAKLGYYKDRVDGIAGPNTEAAVIAFQKAAGLTPDGIVGPATRAALLRALDRKNQDAAAGGGAVVGGGSEAATAEQYVDQAGNVDWSTLGWIIGFGVMGALLVIGLFLLWRYRGPAFAWLPEGVKDFFENRGIILGRRIKT